MASTILNAKTREPHKSTGRALRREGQVPGIYYNSKRDVKYVQFDNIELMRLLNTEFALVELNVDGSALPCVIREIQRHPVRGNIVHVDLFGVEKDQSITVSVPVNIIGIAKGVKADGGTLDLLVHDLEVECLPANIPNHIDIDVTELGINDGIRVENIQIEGVTFTADPQLTVVHVMPPRVQEEAAVEAGAAEEVAEPEVITAKKEESE
ncbi:50S ribosomal protein L25 [bacterium]|nr:50S ribosomal protein L25 [bacterium]MBU1636689.1 50S ribosomal protein L25 [bacterium]MBU1919236.1 50S ribosomal protein L25 [bacterium]